jgi:hypothetical protein
VTAPRCVVLDKDILAGVFDDFLPGGADDGGDGTLGLGLRLRLEGWLEVASLEVINPVLDGVN